MSDSPFLSVIVATYNRSNLIGRAIQSMLDQTSPDWELIIIDDGSTDETKNVVNQFGDYRIMYYYQENAEKSVARNFGIEKAGGKYISFLDDDDYFLPGFLALFYKKIEAENFPIAFFMCDEYVQNKKGRLIKNRVPGNLLDNPVRLLWEIQSSIRPFVIHRDILEAEKFDKRFFLGEDFHLVIRIALKFPFYYLPVGLNVNVDHQEQGTHKKFVGDYRKNARISIMSVDDLLYENKKELSDKIPAKFLFDHRNHHVYAFASAAMKKCDFAFCHKMLGELNPRASLRKTGYHYTSLILRIPVYFFKCLLYKLKGK